MPNIAKVLKDEIARISRHEAKVAVTPIKKPVGKFRYDIAGLKTQVATLEKEVKRLNVLVVNLVSTQPAPVEAADAGRAWIFGKGVKSLRRKLGMTQEEFGKLTGVTSGAVRLWESKPGKLTLRDTTKAAIIAVKGIGKTEARKRLDEMVVKNVASVSKKGSKGKSKGRGKKVVKGRGKKR